MTVTELKTAIETATKAEAWQEVARLQSELIEAQNRALVNNGGSTNGIKISEKKAVSVYGLQRFPVTLYAGSWAKLLGMADKIEGFILANRTRLSWHKDDNEMPSESEARALFGR